MSRQQTTFQLQGSAVVVNGGLPPTASHKGNRFFRAVSPAEHPITRQRWLARVEITQSKKLGVYLLDEVDPRTALKGFRRFVFSALDYEPTEKRPGLYEIIVNPDRVVIRCSCIASTTAMQADRAAPASGNELDFGAADAKSCKHKDVMQALFDAKFFHPEEIVSDGEQTHNRDFHNGGG